MPPACGVAVEDDDLVAERRQVARDRQRRRAGADAGDALAVLRAATARQVLGDVVLEVGGDALQAADRHRLGLARPALPRPGRAGRPARRVGRRCARGCREHVGFPVDEIGVGVAAGRDQADVLGDWGVGRTSPLAIDDFMKVVRIADVGGSQISLSSPAETEAGALHWRKSVNSDRRPRTLRCQQGLRGGNNARACAMPRRQSPAWPKVSWTAIWLPASNPVREIGRAVRSGDGDIRARSRSCGPAGHLRRRAIMRPKTTTNVPGGLDMRASDRCPQRPHAWRLARAAVAWGGVVLLALCAGCAGLPELPDRPAVRLPPATEGPIARVVAPLVAQHPGQTGVVSLGDPRDAFATASRWRAQRRARSTSRPSSGTPTRPAR